MPQMRYVGTSPTKEDALAKALGETLYSDDRRLPGEVFVQVIRARMAPARVKKIDPRAALAIPGVLCVLTAKDIPGANEGRYPNYPVLVEETVSGIGDAIAIVGAETRDLAREAAEKVRVLYEPLPGAYDFLAPEGEVLCDWKTEKGDVEAGFRAADFIAENAYFSACLDHAFIEPEGGLAWMDERGVMNICVPTQAIENAQKVAHTLALPESRVRLICPMVGGAFGGKEHPLLGDFLALAALRTGRPARMAYTREETIRTGSKKHPFQMHYRTGATKDGKLTAVEVDIIADSGSYPTMSRGLVLGGLCISGGPYEIPNARGRARAVATNNPFTEAMRGVGANQVCFAYESQMDEVAAGIGMDPAAFRRRNFIQKGGTLMQKQKVPTKVILPEIMDKVEASMKRNARPKKAGPWRRGVGYAANLAGYGRPRNEGEAYLSIQDDGSVSLRAGATDVGAGQTQTYRQIAAEALGLSLESVTAVMSDSEITPFCGITAGSRQTLISGGATYRAGIALRGRLLQGAAELFEAAVDDLEIEGGKIFVRAAKDRSVTVPEAVKKCKQMGLVLHDTGKMILGKHEYEGNEQYGDAGGWMDYTFGVHAAEAEVNIETGEIRLLDYRAAHDVGQAINRQHVEGQFEGGAMMGIGHALMEEIITKDGVPLTDHFEGYIIPTAMETPAWEDIIAESGEGFGPYGAKGIGEPPCAAAAAAVANAVSNAIGARITRIPITPDHVMEVLGKIKR
ncbi:MAG: xanthine dehydrogenase family protein molybdopterin-binding subunit [bacterium]|nr:xanthine dehydrogenase family protein molybdopterin-binding subunit [bacterium]